ncbi:MAG: lysophospholipid acyltransferase family protein [Bacteroidota bacterium]
MRTFLGTLRFLAGAVISLCMAVVAILSIPLDPRRGRVFHASSRLWARLVLFVCGVKVQVRGLEHVQQPQSYIYVSNHASMFDIPCILAGIPDQIRIVYKKELEVIPVFGWGLKWGSYISIDRSHRASAMRSLDSAAQKIRDGASVLLYAEGTRTTDGKLQPFKRGAFKLAVKAGIPVVPLTINGTFHILRKRSVVIRPGRAELILERPIPVDRDRGKDSEMHLMEQVHEAIAQHYIDQ